MSSEERLVSGFCVEQGSSNSQEIGSIIKDVAVNIDSKTKTSGIKNEETTSMMEKKSTPFESSDNFQYEGFIYQGDFIVSESDKKEYRPLLLGNGLRVLLIHEPEGLGPVGGDVGAAASRPPNRRRQRFRSGDSSVSGSSPASDASSVGSVEEDADDSECDDDDNDEVASARRSAAALCIGSGSADEGVELPGLAHFLEHMVFMGSAKYPRENDFDAYVSERGGESNAWTDMERTLFHFDCRQESFPECLDRFANFFVEPLLRADSLKREVEAVHAEFEEACSSLSSQMEYFVGWLANRGHPLAGFKWGNRTSLWQQPRAKQLDVRSRLQDFRLSHYRAANMTVVLQSRLGLDALEAAARAAFGKLPVGPRTPSPQVPLLSPSDPPFGERFHGRAYRLLPVKQVDRLCLVWSCPPVRSSYLDQPHRLLGFCLAHEGPGSLADCLRREGLAVELEAGVDAGSGLRDNSSASLMELTVKLTPAGLQDWRRVVRLAHTYVGMLGAQLDELHRIYGELRSVERATFRFAEEVEPAESVELLSQNMHWLPAPLWLLGDRVPHRFDAQSLRRYWQTLRPSNACLLIASRSFESTCDQVTDWFEMRFAELPLDQETLTDWEQCVDNPDPQLLADCQLHLPPPNPFIADSFDVPSPEEVYKEISLTSVPQFPIPLSLEDPQADRFGSLHYFKDRKFKTPRAVVRVRFESPVICESLKSSTVAQVWLYMLNFQLHRDAYAANEAGLHYEVLLAEPFAIMIDLEGFNDKLFVLHSAILDKWAQLGDLLEAGDSAALKFPSAREEIRKSLANQLFSPKRFASNIRNYLMERDRYLASDQLECLETLELSDVADFHRRLLSRAFVKVYVHGNCRPGDAKSFFRQALALLPVDCEVAELQNTIASLPVGRQGVRLASARQGDVNSVLVEEFQLPGPPTLRDRVMAELLLHIMWEPCFDFLRTQHQLGYHVACRTSRRRGSLGWHVLVGSQADKVDTERLQSRVDEFVAEFSRQLRDLPAGQFANYVQAALDEILAEDSAMADEADRYWAEIVDGGLLFDRRVREAELLRQLPQTELPGFYERAIGQCRRSFAVQIEGASCKSLQEGGSAGFRLPLSYLLPATAADSATTASRDPDCGGDRGIEFVGELKAFKAGLQFDMARPVIE